MAVASSYLAEVCELLLPEREANDAFFRLVLLVISEIRRTGGIWRPLTYFDLWAVRLAVFLPSLTACLECGTALDQRGAAWFRSHEEGLLCGDCKAGAAWTLSAESRELARVMLSSPLAAISDGWSKQRGEDLRRFLSQQIERHLERQLVTRRPLDALSDQ